MLPGLHVTIFLVCCLFAVGSGDEVGTDLCRLPDGNFPYSEDCASFIRCQSGIPEVERCPEGLLFNPSSSTCDFSVTGNCSNSDDFNSTSAVETSDIACTDESPNVIPITSSCSEYYLCEDGIAFRVQCPSGLLMNGDKMTCDYEQNVECDITSSGEESSIGITAIYESKGEESDVEATNEPEISGETSDISSDITVDSEQTDASLLSTETISQKTEVNSRTSDPSEASTTSDSSITIEASTSNQDSTTVVVTEYTVNKQPTVVTLSTAHTKENTDDSLTEINSETTSLSPIMTKSTIETTSDYATTISDQATSSDTTNPYPDLTSADESTVETKASEESEDRNNSESTVSITEIETQSLITENRISTTTLSKSSLSSQATALDRVTTSIKTTTKASDADFQTEETTEGKTTYQTSPGTEKETFTDNTNDETSSENYLTSESATGTDVNELETSEVLTPGSKTPSDRTSEVSMLTKISTEGTELENTLTTRSKASSDITAMDFTSGSTGTLQEISSSPLQNITGSTLDNSDVSNPDITTGKTMAVTDETPQFTSTVKANDNTNSPISVTSLETENTENIRNDSTTITAVTENTSKLSILPDDPENIDTTTKEKFTTRIQTDSKMTPEGTRSTTQALMSSDPSTENETGEFTTSTYYFTTETEAKQSSMISTTSDLSTKIAIDNSSFGTEISEMITTKNNSSIENQTEAVKTSLHEFTEEDTSTLKSTPEISTINHEDLSTINDSLTIFSTVTSENTPGTSINTNDFASSTIASDYTTSQIDVISTSTVSSENIFHSSSMQGFSTEPETTIELEMSSESSSLGTMTTINETNKTTVELASKSDSTSLKTLVTSGTDITEQEIVSEHQSSESTSKTDNNLISDGTSELIDTDSTSTLSSEDSSTLAHTSEISEQKTSSLSYDLSTHPITTVSESSSEFFTIEDEISTTVIPSNDGSDTSEESTFTSDLIIETKTQTSTTASTAKKSTENILTTFSAISTKLTDVTEGLPNTEVSELTRSSELPINEYSSTEAKVIASSDTTISEELEPTRSSSQTPLPETSSTFPFTDFSVDISKSTSETFELSSFTDIETNDAEESTSESISESKPTNISPEDATPSTKITNFEEISKTTETELATSLPDTTSGSDTPRSTAESAIPTESTLRQEITKEIDQTSVHTETTYVTSPNGATDFNITESTLNSTFNEREISEIPVTGISSISSNFESSSVSSFETAITSTPTDLETTHSTENVTLTTEVSTSNYNSTSDSSNTNLDPNTRKSTTADTFEDTSQTTKMIVSTTDISNGISDSDLIITAESFIPTRSTSGPETSETSSDTEVTYVTPSNENLIESTLTTTFNGTEVSEISVTEISSLSSNFEGSTETTVEIDATTISISGTKISQSTEASTYHYRSTSELLNTTVDQISTKSTTLDTTFEDISKTTKMVASTTDISNGISDSDLIITAESFIPTRSTSGPETAKTSSDTEVTYVTPSNENLTELYSTESTLTTTFNGTEVSEISSLSSNFEGSTEATVETDATAISISGTETTQSAENLTATEASTYNYRSTSELLNTTVDQIATKSTTLDTTLEDIAQTGKTEILTSFPKETSISNNLKPTTESVISTKSTVDSDLETTEESSKTSSDAEITHVSSYDNFTDLYRTESVLTSTFSEPDASEISVTETSSQSSKSESSSENAIETVMTSTPTPDLEISQSTGNEGLTNTGVSTLTYESTSKSPNSTDNDPISRISTTVGATSETNIPEQTEKSTSSSMPPVATYGSTESVELNVTADTGITISNKNDSESSTAAYVTDTTLQTKMIETTATFEEARTSIPISISTSTLQTTTETITDSSVSYRTNSSDSNNTTEGTLNPITSSNITMAEESTSSLEHVTAEELTSDLSYKVSSTLPTTLSFETSASNFISTTVETSRTESHPYETTFALTTDSDILRTTYEEVIPSKYTMDLKSTKTTRESTTEDIITNAISTKDSANSSETIQVISTEFQETSARTEESKSPFITTTNSYYTSEKTLETVSSEVNTETPTTLFLTNNTRDLNTDYSTTTYPTSNETGKATSQTFEPENFSLTTNDITPETETISEDEIFSSNLPTSSSALQTEETSTHVHTSKETSQTVENSSYGTTVLDTSSDVSSVNGLTSDNSDLPTDISKSSSASDEIDVSSNFSSTISVSGFSTTSFENTDLSTVDMGTPSFSEITELTTKDYSTDKISTVTGTDSSVDFSTHISSTTDFSDVNRETSDLSSVHTLTDLQTFTASPSESTTVLNICLEPDGFYPNPDDCNTFYQCTKGVPKLSWCTVAYHFSPESEACEDPCLAKCDPNADCPTTESDNGSGESTLRTTLTENIHSSSQSDSTETKEISLFTISTKDIQTKITETPEDLISVSGITSGEISTGSDVSPIHYSSPSDLDSTETEETSPLVTSDIQTESRIPDDLTSVSGFTSGEISSESDASPSHYFTASNSVSANDSTVSTLGITTTYTSDQSTLEVASMSTNERSLEPFTSITSRSTTEGLSESTSHDFHTSSTKDQMTTIESSISTVSEQYSSEKTSTSTTEAISEISSNIETEKPTSSKTEETSSESEEDISSASTTSYIGSTSADASTENTYVPGISTSVTPTKCGNNDCISSPSTPIPYSVCHRNDFLSRPSCNEYNDCTGKFPVKKQCPLGLYFNPSTRVCDWPYNAGCGEVLKPLYEPDYFFKCPCQSCLIPSSTSCSHYYLCLGYTAYHLKCSYNLFFDRIQNTCNYKEMVNCLISTSTTTTSKQTTTSTAKSTYSTTIEPERFICPSRNGLYRYPGNCGKFYQCSNFHPYEMDCPASTHFSEQTKRCEYPCDAKCDSNLNCGIYPTAAPRDPRCSCQNCKLPSTETCTKFIVCINGKARMENCPWGQTFDVRKKTCDWAHKVTCHHSEICPKQNGMFPHKDCHKFVHCSNGIPYIKDCPSTLEFDPVKQRCEWPAGRCSHSPIPKEFEVFKKKEYREGWRCPKTFGYFPDDHNCNKFYYCSLGTPSLKECSNGLLYNPRYQTCDWKEHVRCHSNRHTRPRRCRVYDSHARCSRDRNPLPHTHCNMYYDCTAGRACAKQCPVGLYFNDMTGLCDLPVNVKCPHQPEDYSLKEFSFTCSSHDHGRLSDPGDAACYYHCRQGKVIYGCCSKGHVYNQHKDKCERRMKSIKI